MNKKKKSTNTSPYPDEASKEKQSVPTGNALLYILLSSVDFSGCVRRAHPVFSLLYIRCTKLRILMGETIPLYRAMTSHFLWASRTMPLHKQGQELRSEQTAIPIT